MSLCFSEQDQLAKINVTGIKLFGDEYHFLSASSNQLRAHGAVFVKAKNSVVGHIRAKIVQNTPEFKSRAKYLSRVGLFSTSDLKKGDVNMDQVAIMEDIKVPVEAIFLFLLVRFQSALSFECPTYATQRCLVEPSSLAALIKASFFLLSGSERGPSD